jgi:steroid 5-alpha reductase family enzyme
VLVADRLLPVWGLLALAPAMLVAWARQRRTRDAGLVDLVWSAGLGFLAVLYAWLASGWAPRRILVAVLAGTWSARLALHLAARIRRGPEDGRYSDLRRRLGPRFDVWMLWFFQAQALLAVLLSVAYLIPCAAPDQGFGPRDLAAVALWIAALAGESLADHQLRVWRTDPANAGRTCRSGLWRYSRHPNYFFEWLHWLVYPVLSIGLPLGWIAWVAPALMLVLILRVTGIPPAERQAMQSRGDDYRDYQRSTNAFFPGPPRASSLGSPSSP